MTLLQGGSAFGFVDQRNRRHVESNNTEPSGSLQLVYNFLNRFMFFLTRYILGCFKMTNIDECNKQQYKYIELVQTLTQFFFSNLTTKRRAGNRL